MGPGDLSRTYERCKNRAILWDAHANRRDFQRYQESSFWLEFPTRDVTIAATDPSAAIARNAGNAGSNAFRASRREHRATASISSQHDPQTPRTVTFRSWYQSHISQRRLAFQRSGTQCKRSNYQRKDHMPIAGILRGSLRDGHQEYLNIAVCFA